MERNNGRIVIERDFKPQSAFELNNSKSELSFGFGNDEHWAFGWINKKAKSNSWSHVKIAESNVSLTTYLAIITLYR